MDEHIEGFKNYLSSERNYSGHTVKAYMTDIKEFCKVLKDKNLLQDIPELDEAHVRAYISWLYTRNTKVSISRKIATVRTFFEYLLRNGVLKKKYGKARTHSARGKETTRVPDGGRGSEAS